MGRTSKQTTGSKAEKKGRATGQQITKAKPKREPNEREVAAIAAARQNRKLRPARAAFAEFPGSRPGVLSLESPHSDNEGHPYLVAETFGSGSDDFTTASITLLANLNTREGGIASVDALNANLAVVGAIAPQNELEAALAVQMAATHDLSVEMLRRTKAAGNVALMREYGNLATKLSRTFTAQMKALSDWRRGGEQVVRHVHVYEGGQAVVAETVNVGGQNAKRLEQSYGQGALIAALPCPHPEGHGMPVASHEGQEAVSYSRGHQPGGSEGQH